MPGKTSPKNILWVPMAVRLASAAALLFVTVFIGFDINRRAFAIQNIERELAHRRNLHDAYERLKSEAGQAERSASFLTNVLPTPDELVSFPRELQAIAEPYGLTIGFKFKDQTSSTETTPGTLSFHMTASGTFERVIAFLKALEKSRFFIELNTIELNRGQNTYSVSLSGLVFSR